MVDQGMLQASGISAEIAANLPRYDPLAPEKGAAARRSVMLISLLIHALLLALFWNVLLGVVVEKDDTVVVKMIEEQIPEPPKLKRKVLQQRVLDASVQERKNIIQPEIVEVKPVPVLDQVNKVEVKRTEITEAPKQIEQRKIVTEKQSVFAERKAVAQPVEIAKAAQITRVQAAKPTAGPRKLKAAGPVTNAREVKVAAPTITSGKISNSAVEGDVAGAEVADIESGTSSRFLKGDGDRGGLVGEDKDCLEDPVCRAYIEEIRRRVYARWNVPPELSGGRVVMHFRLDRGGSAHSISLVGAEDELGKTCLTAFRRASPFPPPPKEISYIIGKSLKANFTAD